LQVLKARGVSRVMGVDPFAYRRDLARQVVDCEVLNPLDGDIVAKIFEITDNKGVDLAFEASGNKTGRDQALRSSGLGKRVHYVGIALGILEIDFVFQFVHPERILSASWWSEYNEFDRNLQYVLDGKVKLKPMVTHHYGLEDINGAFEAAVSKDKYESIKVIIHPNER
jgi:L-iditol 2-dehydrogenase